MFEKVTGFFRRFRSKRKTSETAMLAPDDAAFDDFELDDADFGDTIATGELGGDPGGDVDFGGDFDSGEDQLDSLSGVDTFETLGDGAGAAGSLSGGSGESLLEDSEAQADTFDSLGGDLGSADLSPSADSDSDGFGSDADDFDADFGGGFDDLAGGAAPDALDEEIAAAPLEAAKVRVPILIAALVVSLLVGGGAGIVVPTLMGDSGGPPLEQVLQKVQSDLKKAERSLAAYARLGGLAAVEQLKVDLAAATEQYAEMEALEAAADEARTREEAYDVVLASAQAAQRQTAENDAARAALAQEITAARELLASQRRDVIGAMADYQRRHRAMEASAVVAGAFNIADAQYTHDRVREMAVRTYGAPAGE